MRAGVGAERRGRGPRTRKSDGDDSDDDDGTRIRFFGSAAGRRTLRVSDPGPMATPVASRTRLAADPSLSSLGTSGELGATGAGRARLGGDAERTPDGAAAKPSRAQRVAWRRADALLSASRPDADEDEVVPSPAGAGGTGGAGGAGGGLGSTMGSVSGGAAAAGAMVLGTRRLDAGTYTKKNIRSIMSKEDGPGASATALIAGLETNVRDVLDTKRREYDDLMAQTHGLEETVVELKLRLQDLRADCAALGLEDVRVPRDERGERKRSRGAESRIRWSARLSPSSLPPLATPSSAGRDGTQREEGR